MCRPRKCRTLPSLVHLLAAQLDKERFDRAADALCVLLIDRVLELDKGKRVVAIKAVTANEPQFTGHFPGRPIMPGVLMVEAMAQAGAVAVLSLPENRGKLALFAGIDECRFRRTVLPGDTLRIEVTVEKLSRLFGKARTVASVDGEVAVEATLSFIIPRDQSIAGGPAGPTGSLTDG